MKKSLLKFSLSILMAVHFCGFSQEKDLAKAEENYNEYAFAKAIDIYEKVAEKGYGSVEVYQNLGNSYYFNADLINAGKWYKKLFDLDEDIEPEYYFRYSHSLKAEGDYKKSDKMMKKFMELTSSDGRGKLYKPDYLDLIKLQSGRFDINNLAFNSEYSDFAPSFYKGKLVFSSARDTGSYAKNKHNWNDKYFLDLYTGTVAESGVITEVESFSKKLNTKFHESTSAFTADGTVVYFTRNNFVNGSKGKDEKGITKLKILRATINSHGDWTNVKELPFNSDNYSIAHPALSVDETKLYFASDMPGTKGLSDIFVVDINIDGTFGDPINVKNINTEGRETFPFVSLNNDLYFSSDARPGLGGLDVYVAKLESITSVGDIYNVGRPINSAADDFTFVIDDKTGLGFFSSNRNGGEGSDDIYFIKQNEELVAKCKKPIKGIVIDENTKAPLANAKVFYVNADNEVEESMVTNEDGAYNFIINCDEASFIRASKNDYLTNEVKVDTSLVSVDIELERSVVTATVGDDLAKVLDLNTIYFDLDKSFIRKDARVELEKVVAAMKKYPTLKIDVRAHTDSRAGDDYNMQLSERRAKATITYIVNQGIDKSRVSGKGYGETQLINTCSNGVKCSKEQHQLNRRSEFIISK